MKKEMLINCLQSEEIRIAIIEDGILEELYVERASHESYVGNIYKGRVVNIEPSIQAAFVDFGVGRNGFLHVSDVEPAYYRDIEMQQDRRRGGGDRGGRGGDRGGRGGDRGGRGGRGGDRGGRGGDRGGRGRQQPRAYDDFDAPRQDHHQPLAEHGVEAEIVETPAAPTESTGYDDAPPPPVHDGPDIIVEEIYEEDEFHQPPAEGTPDIQEPPALQEEWPAPTETPPIETVDEYVELPPAESVETPADEGASVETSEAEPTTDDKDEAGEGKSKKRGSRRQGPCASWPQAAQEVIERRAGKCRRPARRRAETAAHGIKRAPHRRARSGSESDRASPCSGPARRRLEFLDDAGRPNLDSARRADAGLATTTAAVDA